MSPVFLCGLLMPVFFLGRKTESFIHSNLSGPSYLYSVDCDSFTFYLLIKYAKKNKKRNANEINREQQFESQFS